MYTVNPNEYKRIFAVPSSVTEKHIKTAGALSLKVLLLVLSQPQITSENMAEILNVSVPDVKDAANFWIANGIFASSDVEENQSPKQTSTLTDSQNVKRISLSPVKLNGKSLDDRIKESSDLKYLKEEAGKYLGRDLLASDLSSLTALYDWAGLSVDIILMIISYCASINKTNMRSIEKLTLDCLDKGIDTHEAVAAHIKELTLRNTNESAVKSVFGIYNRALTTKEKNYINTWFSDMHFNIEMIKLAYEKTIDSTGKMAFPYINKILVSWSEKGIHTPAQVEEEQKLDTKGGKKTSVPSYDLDGINKLINDKIV